MINGYINLIWILEFDGGFEQLFILFLEEEVNWRVVVNIIDLGEGKVVYVEFGLLILGEEYVFQLQSCNSINCFLFVDDIRVIVKGRSKISQYVFFRILDGCIYMLIFKLKIGF